jgi:hypothetical protein
VRIHILCPSDRLDGSAESLHQFGRMAATIGYDTRIAYLPCADGPVVEEFRSYGLHPDQDVPDEPTLLVVTDHVHAAELERFSRAEKLVWWLRLDESDTAAIERALALPAALQLAASEHARRFLESRGVSARLIGDYIHAGYRELADARAGAGKLDVVLYNPDDPSGFLARLIEASQHVLQWVPVSGIARTEVAELMANAKLYVDFGPHRGRTRLLREALAARCVVVTGSAGAAGNELDLPLPDGFRFDETDQSDENLMAVLNRIAHSLMDFAVDQPQFQPLFAGSDEDEKQARRAVRELLTQLNELVEPESVLVLPSERARSGLAADLAGEVRHFEGPGGVEVGARQPILTPSEEQYRPAPGEVPSISVAIATIPPRANLLSRALASVTAQTLAPTAVIVEWDHNRTGAGPTKNRAIEKVTTEWLAMLDDDDAFLPDHLEKLYRCAMETGADVVYPIPRWEIPDGYSANTLRFGLPFDPEELRRRPYIPNTVLVRTELVCQVGGFECYPGTAWDDYGLFIKLLDAGAKFVHLTEVTWVWNQRGQNTAGLPTSW